MLNNNNFNIAIIGLGYVGLPLSIEFSKKYTTYGFDNNLKRIKDLRKGIDETLELKSRELLTSDLILTSTIKDIKDCNIYIITVPTPIDKNNNPDLMPLEHASRSIGKLIDKGNLVIYESTVYPGATEEFCVPILESESKLKYNIDFFCGYSPERINPSDKKHTLKSIKKITSGSNDNIASIVDGLYKSIISAGTYKVSSIPIAESAKVIENIQRDVNIALINELAIIFNKLNLDTQEILEAAGSKWNFLNFRPGLVGGHCISVDPYYLTYKAKAIGYNPEIVLSGRRINDSMAEYIAEETISLMRKLDFKLKNSIVGMLGLTFKENCPDLRNSQAPLIANSMRGYGCNILVSDPYVNKEQVNNIYGLKLVDISEMEKVDVLIVAVAHNEYISLDRRGLLNLLNSNGILIDVKSIYTKCLLSDSSIFHWRL